MHRKYYHIPAKIIVVLVVLFITNSVFGQGSIQPPLHRPLLLEGSVRSAFCTLPQRRIAVASCNLSKNEFDVTIFSREGKRLRSSLLSGKWDGNDSGMNILHVAEGILLTFGKDVWLLSTENLKIKWHRQDECQKTLTSYGVVFWPTRKHPQLKVLSLSGDFSSDQMDESWDNIEVLKPNRKLYLGGMPTEKDLVFLTVNFEDNRDLSLCRIIRCGLASKSIEEVRLSSPKRRKEFNPKIVRYDQRSDSVLIATTQNTVECWDAVSGDHLHSIPFEIDEIEGAEITNVFASGDRDVVFANLDGRNSNAFIVGRRGQTPTAMWYDIVENVSSTPSEDAISFTQRVSGSRHVYSGDYKSGFVDGVRIGLKLPSDPEQLLFGEDGTIWLEDGQSSSSRKLWILPPSQKNGAMVTEKVWRNVFPDNYRGLRYFAKSGKSELIAPLVTLVPETNYRDQKISLVTVNKDGKVSLSELQNKFNIRLGKDFFEKTPPYWSPKNQTLYFLGLDGRSLAEKNLGKTVICLANPEKKSAIPAVIDGNTESSSEGSPEFLKAISKTFISFDETQRNVVAGPFDFFTESKEGRKFPGDSYRYVFYDTVNSKFHTLRLRGNLRDMFRDVSPFQQSLWMGQRFCVITSDQKVAWWDEPAKKKSVARVDDGQIRGQAKLLFPAGQGRLGVISENRNECWVTLCTFDADGLVIEHEKKTDSMPDFVENGIGFECHFNRVVQTQLVE